MNKANWPPREPGVQSGPDGTGSNNPPKFSYQLVALPLGWGMTGVAVGLAVWVAIISQAHSYLSDAPEVCVNCHVMRSAFASWSHSSHREVATCNDCHVPHQSFWMHWLFKAEDGLRHATVFTLRREPEVIRLSRRAEPVVEGNCRRCHANVLHDTRLASFDEGGVRCWDCHHSPHSEPHSLSSFELWISGK